MVNKTTTMPAPPLTPRTETELTPQQIAGGVLVFDGVSGLILNFTAFNGIMSIVRTGIGAWLLSQSPERRKKSTTIIKISK